MIDLAWSNDPWKAIAFICGSGGLGAIITWVYYAKQLRHASDQLSEQKKLNDVQVKKMRLEIEKLRVEKELVDRDLANKKGTVLQSPTLEQVQEYAEHTKRYSLQFTAPRSFADQIKADPGIMRGDISIKDVQAEQDATSLQFGINDAVSVSTEIASGFYFGELAESLLHWMRESDSSRVFIQTPFRMVEAKSDVATEDSLRQLLLQAMEP